MAKVLKEAWISMKEIVKSELRRYSSLRKQTQEFLVNLSAESLAHYINEFRDPENKWIGPAPDYSQAFNGDPLPFWKKSRERKLASLIAPFLRFIENRHASFESKIVDDSETNPVASTFDPNNKRTKAISLSAVNSVLDRFEPFSLEPTPVYKTKKTQTLAKSELAAITGIQYYLLNFIRVVDAGEKSSRRLKDYELDCLTCALLAKVSSISSLKKLNSGSLDKKLRGRRGGEYQASPSELRARFEEKYVVPSEKSALILAALESPAGAAHMAHYRLVRSIILSAARRVPLASFFKKKNTR